MVGTSDGTIVGIVGIDTGCGTTTSTASARTGYIVEGP
jgi:hypothetical protein